MANALIPNQNILNRRGYSDEGIDLSLYQDRTGYGLAQLDPYGRVQIGGDPGLQEYLNYLAAPQTREVMGNVLADTIPVSAQGQAIERLKQQYTDLQNAQSPIQAAVRAADMGLEGGALVADVLPYGKAAVAGGGALAALMARRTAPLTGMATAPQAANQLGMTGWHGSPHKFDRFDHSNMGKGEGAQAYGWGTYIAENPDVAQSYRVNIGSPSKEFYIGGKVIPKNDIRFGIADDILSHGETKARIHAKANGPEFLRAFEEIKGKVQGDRAHLYEVDLPDEKIAQMLDWDAPLSEQPESVRRAFENIANTDVGREAARSLGVDDIRKAASRYGGELKGEDIHGLIYEGSPRGTENEAVSKYLHSQGIPGIKYFDGNSRGAGQGTRNFVVFDENDMKILTRNGEEIAQSAESLPNMFKGRADKDLSKKAEAMFLWERAARFDDPDTAEAFVDQVVSPLLEPYQGYIRAKDLTIDEFFSEVSENLSKELGGQSKLDDMRKYYRAMSEPDGVRKPDAIIKPIAQSADSLSRGPVWPEKIKIAPVTNNEAEIYGIKGVGETSILKNPSQSDLNRWAGRDIRSVRSMVTKDGDLYVWPADEAVHKQVLDSLNLSNEDLAMEFSDVTRKPSEVIDLVADSKRGSERWWVDYDDPNYDPREEIYVKVLDGDRTE